jgi:hypothetical protein
VDDTGGGSLSCVVDDWSEWANWSNDDWSSCWSRCNNNGALWLNGSLVCHIDLLVTFGYENFTLWLNGSLIGTLVCRLGLLDDWLLGYDSFTLWLFDNWGLLFNVLGDNWSLLLNGDHVLDDNWLKWTNWQNWLQSLDGTLESVNNWVNWTNWVNDGNGALWVDSLIDWQNSWVHDADVTLWVSGHDCVDWASFVDDGGALWMHHRMHWHNRVRWLNWLGHFDGALWVHWNWVNNWVHWQNWLGRFDRELVSGNHDWFCGDGWLHNCGRVDRLEGDQEDG